MNHKTFFLKKLKPISEKHHVLMLTKNQQTIMKKSQKRREMTNEERWMAIGFLKGNFNI